MGLIPDVDLDVSDRVSAIGVLPLAVPATQFSADKRSMVIHNTGVYLQDVPRDPLQGRATFPYQVAEELGYYKLDLIKNGAYDLVRDEQHLIDLLAVAEGNDFPWDLFQEERFFNNTDTSLRITHLANHFDVCGAYPPDNVMDVAILIALIRPRKKYLIGEHWSVIQEKIWLKLPEEESSTPGNYFFKKSHAVAFALLILVHIQVLAETFTSMNSEP